MTRRTTTWLVCVLLTITCAAYAAPIHTYAKKGDTTGVEYALGKDPSAATAVDSTGATPLHYAAQGGHAAAARMLLDAGADVSARNKDGATPLHDAVANKQRAMAELLIQRGADANAKKNNGVTPLMVAASFGPLGVVELLCDKGADANASDDSGRTALSIARERGHQDIADYLYQRTDNGQGTGPDGPVQIGYGSIMVNVKDSSGSPLAGATVSAGDRSMATDTGGMAVLSDVLTGMYIVTAQKEDYGSASQSNVEVSAGQVARVNLELRSTLGSIHGAVRDHTGAPVSGATVSVPGRTYSQITGSDGSFRIERVLPGTFDLVVNVDGKEVGRRTGLSVSAGETTAAEIALAPPPSNTVMIAAIVGGIVVCIIAIVVVISVVRRRRAGSQPVPRPGAERAYVPAPPQVQQTVVAAPEPEPVATEQLAAEPLPTPGGFCVRCGTSYPAGSQFCAGCGRPTVQAAPTPVSTIISAGFCPGCGGPLTTADRFCPACGATPAPAAQPPDGIQGLGFALTNCRIALAASVAMIVAVFLPLIQVSFESETFTRSILQGAPGSAFFALLFGGLALAVTFARSKRLRAGFHITTGAYMTAVLVYSLVALSEAYSSEILGSIGIGFYVLLLGSITLFIVGLRERREKPPSGSVELAHRPRLARTRQAVIGLILVLAAAAGVVILLSASGAPPVSITDVSSVESSDAGMDGFNLTVRNVGSERITVYTEDQSAHSKWDVARKRMVSKPTDFRISASYHVRDSDSWFDIWYVQCVDVGDVLTMEKQLDPDEDGRFHVTIPPHVGSADEVRVVIENDTKSARVERSVPVD